MSLSPNTPANPMRVVVVGLGYVGLPLAVALADSFETWGFDIDQKRILELNEGKDRTGEVDSKRLANSHLKLTCDPYACPAADFYIVTVPTPVNQLNTPDLSILLEATRVVGSMLKRGRGAIVVYESTVYPGVTENICGPELERVSGLTCGEDFFLGYSPERINPGDRDHTIDRITKVVSGQTSKVVDAVAELYGSITKGGVFRASSIKVAEAAKVIENAQRDINIAFINEVSQIFGKMNISVWDVLDAARTKWNFLNFSPGLVGGHCIGVDPYYLAYRANELGCEPRIILAGRNTNDGMAEWVAKSIHTWKNEVAGRVLVLGIAFKPDVPDVRNSKVANLVSTLSKLGHSVDVYDPLVSAEETKREYGINTLSTLPVKKYDTIVLAVPHRQIIKIFDDIMKLMDKYGGVADLKNAISVKDRERYGASVWSL